MNCPYCDSPSRVTNSRSRAKDTEIWRRRKCIVCKQVWTTQEVITLSTSHRIVTAAGHFVPFSRDRLFMSIKDALQHRKTALGDATALTETVIYQLLRQHHADIPIATILTLTATALSRFDRVAGEVYAARYQLR